MAAVLSSCSSVGMGRRKPSWETSIEWVRGLPLCSVVRHARDHSASHTRPRTPRPNPNIGRKPNPRAEAKPSRRSRTLPKLEREDVKGLSRNCYVIAKERVCSWRHTPSSKFVREIARSKAIMPRGTGCPSPRRPRRSLHLLCTGARRTGPHSKQIHRGALALFAMPHACFASHLPAKKPRYLPPTCRYLGNLCVIRTFVRFSSL